MSVPEKYMAQLALNSYSGQFDCGSEIIYSGGVDNTQFHVLDDGTHTILTFTGSNEMKDWLTHLLVRRRNNVHRGHLRDFEEVAPKLRWAMDQKPRERLICASHSYGCSIQCIALRDIARENRFSHVQVASFGSPRIGNKEFCMELDSLVPNHKRYVNRYDVVTKVPLGFGYRHCGMEIKFATGRHTMFDYARNVGYSVHIKPQ